MWGLRGALVVLGFSVAAQAQPAGDASPSPPVPTPTPTTTPPIAPPTTSAAATAPSDDWTVDRHGLMLLGGFDFVSGERTQFAVLYIPMPLPGAPRFKLGLTGSLQYQQQIVLGGDDLILWAYYLQPMAQYDWRLPIVSSSGDFAIAAEGGLGFGQIWASLPSGAFMPPGWEHVTFYTLSADAAFQFHAHNGFVVSVQPVGFTMPLNRPSAPDPRWTVTADAAYIISIGAGYRWR
jgi:hypothetical protein